jgi:hypothetical protein
VFLPDVDALYRIKALGKIREDVYPQLTPHAMRRPHAPYNDPACECVRLDWPVCCFIAGTHRDWLR